MKIFLRNLKKTVEFHLHLCYNNIVTTYPDHINSSTEQGGNLYEEFRNEEMSRMRKAFPANLKQAEVLLRRSLSSLPSMRQAHLCQVS